MSALPPHEMARRNQVLADMDARLARGEYVIAVVPIVPGCPCTWCDCPIVLGSPHYRPGYVCPYYCHAGASAAAICMYMPKPKETPLCSRHVDVWRGEIAELLGDRVVIFDLTG